MCNVYMAGITTKYYAVFGQAAQSTTYIVFAFEPYAYVLQYEIIMRFPTVWQ